MKFHKTIVKNIQNKIQPIIVSYSVTWFYAWKFIQTRFTLIIAKHQNSFVQIFTRMDIKIYLNRLRNVFVCDNCFVITLSYDGNCHSYYYTQFKLCELQLDIITLNAHTDVRWVIMDSFHVNNVLEYFD